jgi:hypothetical protein
MANFATTHGVIRVLSILVFVGCGPQPHVGPGDRAPRG